jgi:mRNA interferase MazF
MTNYNPGDVLLLPFPFSDISNTKKRPALVLAVAEKWGELVCAMLTSSPQY